MKATRWMLCLAVLWLATLWSAGSAEACGGAGNCFLRGAGNGTWSNTAAWSSTASNGSSCTCTPATTDSVFLDAGSPAASTISASIQVTSVDMTGYTGTLTQNGGVTLTWTGATFKFASGMTYTLGNNSTSALQYLGTATTTMTNAGKTIGNFTINGAGADVVLADALTTTNVATVTLTQGTFDAQTNNVAVHIGLFSSSNTNTRSVLEGTGGWQITGTTGTVWDFTTTTGLTFTETTMGSPQSSITFNGAATAARTFNTGAKTYNSITLTGCSTCAANRFSMSGGATVTTFAITPPFWIGFGGNVTTTITNAFTMSGTSSSQFLITSDNVGGTANPATLAVGGASTISWAGIGSIVGATSAITATNSLNFGSNGGTLTIAPPAAGSPHYIGG